MIWIFCSGLLVWLGGCTENPFSDNIFSGTDGQSIAGVVHLENSGDPSGVFVWLKDFNLKTYTDSNGKFSFNLPSKQQSHPGGGLTGYYTIYFYLENYELVARQVYLFDGAVDYAKSDMDAKGFFKSVLEMPQLVAVNTFLDQRQIDDTEYPGLIFTANFTSVHGKDIRITTYLLRGGGWGRIILLKNGNPADSTKFIDLGATLGSIHFSTRSSLSIRLPATQWHFAAGSYTPVPYFFVERDLPDGLIDALGREKRSFSKDFFNLPLRYDSTPFRISN